MMKLKAVVLQLYSTLQTHRELGKTKGLILRVSNSMGLSLHF